VGCETLAIICRLLVGTEIQTVLMSLRKNIFFIPEYTYRNSPINIVKLKQNNHAWTDCQDIPDPILCRLSPPHTNSRSNMSNTSAGCFAMALTDDIDTQVEHEW